MVRMNLEDLPDAFRTYLQRVEAGETLVIFRSGMPVAEVKSTGPSSEGLRPFGLCAGEFDVPDDFDLPLPAATLHSFEG